MLTPTCPACDRTSPLSLNDGWRMRCTSCGHVGPVAYFYEPKAVPPAMTYKRGVKPDAEPPPTSPYWWLRD